MPSELVPAEAPFTGDLENIAQICGREVALALQEDLPGLDLHIPKPGEPKGILGQLEDEIADKLIQAFGGHDIYVTNDKHKKCRREDALAMREQGFDNKMIALQLGVSERHVRSLLKGRKLKLVDDRQLNLDF